MIQHLAIIMDGNRRWAKAQGLIPSLGHRQGAEKVELAIKFCLKQKIKHLSLYTFSLENFKRSEFEKNFLFSLLIEQANKNCEKLIESKVCVKFIGDRTKFPPSVMAACQQLEKETSSCRELNLYFNFCYGGQQEIISGVKNILKEIRNNKINEEDINETNFKEYLWSHNIPDPEIIVRTGGINRLSNFFLFQAAYSELFFLDCLWPDLTEENLQNVFDEFKLRIRNYGI